MKVRALLLAVLAGCGGPRAFVPAAEPLAARLELPPETAYDAAWDAVVLRLREASEIEAASKEDGRVETAWSPPAGPRKHRVRARARFAPDRRSLVLETPAESRARAGYDRDLLEALLRDLRKDLGASVDLAAAPEERKLHYRAGVSVWLAGLDGFLESEGGSTNLDFAGDLDHARALFPKLRFGVMFRHGIYVEAWGSGARVSGAANLKSDEIVDGTPFAAGTRVRSELEFMAGGVAAGIELPLRGPASWRIAPELGLQVFSADLHVRGPSTSASSSRDLLAFSPGFRFEIRTDSPLYLQGNVHALLGIYPGVELEGGLGLEVKDRMRLELGWRYLGIDDVFGPNTEFRTSFGGPILGLDLTF